MRPQNLSQCGMKQMSHRVVFLDLPRPPPRHRVCPGTPAILRKPVENMALAIVTLLYILHPDAIAIGDQLSGVGDLPSALGIERGAVKNSLHPVSGYLDSPESHLGLCLIVSGKLKLPLFRCCEHPPTLSLTIFSIKTTTGTPPLPLLLHELPECLGIRSEERRV